MRASSWMLLVLASVAVGACAGAPPQSKPEAAPREVASVEVVATAPTSASVTTVATAVSSSVANAEVPPEATSGEEPLETTTRRGELPIVCEAYFARFRHCMDATMRKHPDEATRAEMKKQFDKAEQSSRAQMSAGMEPTEAEAYCKQALVALTASTCE